MIYKIALLTDYKRFFGSKQDNYIYRGGMDIDKIISSFKEAGYNAEAIPFSQMNVEELRYNYSIVLYTSSEDIGDHYKSYLEDIIFDLEQNNIIVIPPYKYFKAHNNKVAMELLRRGINDNRLNTIISNVYGTLEELKDDSFQFKYPVVIKTFSGAMSKGVKRAANRSELLKTAAYLMRTRHLKHDIKEIIREIKYKNRYIKESFYRKKIVVQNFIPDLDNDWKVLVYGNKCYVLFRGNRKNDFRASGSGYFEFKKDIPDGILDYSLEVRELFDVPHISLDIGFDRQKFHLLEFQFLYFGTTTIEKSPHYFEKIDGQWRFMDNKSDLEEVYVQSIVEFLGNRHYLV